MDYQKEYANLVGQVDRVISILETYEPGDAIVKKAGELLLSALREAEEHYIQEYPVSSGGTGSAADASRPLFGEKRPRQGEKQTGSGEPRRVLCSRLPLSAAEWS